jgi:uncharacterized protein DUF4365
MGFFDNPIVDDSSKISEESVLATRQAFLQKHGFLVREENPDKGVDFDVELIVDNQVSGFKFAIQIKSAEHLKTSKKSGLSYIKYSMKTSRLGYLCRRKPGLGLIVVFNDKTSDLYYDYVEKICTRIMKEHSDSNWMCQDTVTFTIPAGNLIKNNTVQKIYKTMKQRFDRFSEMYAKRAFDYDLPILDIGFSNNPVEILNEYGYIFFNKKEYQILYSLFSDMSFDKILNNPKITLLAAITYYETGRLAEATFFLKKSEMHANAFDELEKELLNLTSINLDYSLGRLEIAEYLRKLNKLELTAKGKMNLVFIKLQSVRMKLLQVDIFKEVSLECIYKEIDKITSIIYDLEESNDISCLYLVEVATFIHEIGVQRFLKTTSRMMIRKAMLGPDVEDDQLTKDLKVIVSLTINSHAILNQVLEISSESNNDYVKAVTLYKKNYMFFSLLMQTIVAAIAGNRSLDEFKNEGSGFQLKTAYSQLTDSYNIFRTKNALGGAYNSLCIAREINYLFSFLNSRNIDDAVHQQVEVALASVEKELQLPALAIASEELIIKILGRSRKATAQDYKQMSPEEKEQFATYTVQASGLPPERVENILSEIEFMVDAAEVINEKYFEILQNRNHTKDVKTLYQDKPRFIIRCKACNYSTIESDKLQILLSCLKSDHPHYCL